MCKMKRLFFCFVCFVLCLSVVASSSEVYAKTAENDEKPTGIQYTESDSKPDGEQQKNDSDSSTEKQPEDNSEQSTDKQPEDNSETTTDKQPEDNSETTTEKQPEETENASTGAEEDEKERISGDTDGDNKITSSDARLTLRASVLLEEFTDAQKKACDMDSDGKISAADSRIILRFAVGLPAKEEEKHHVPNKPKPFNKEAYIKSVIDRVSEKTINSNIKYLCNTIGARPVETNALKKAKNFIYEKLEEYGYKKDRLKTQRVERYSGAENVIAVIPTKAKNADIIVFSAHYDSAYVGAGAIDNGSGLCAMLELARVMKEQNTDFGFEARFCFFTAEEMGYYGAYAYIDSLTKAEKEKHVLVFNCDMAAKTTENKDFYLCVSTEPVSRYYPKRTAQKNLGSQAIDSAKMFIGSCTEKKYHSPVAAGKHDILPFRELDIPACTLSWRESDKKSKECDFGLIPPRIIHTNNDTLQYLDMNSLYCTTRLIAASAAEICAAYVQKTK